MMNNRKIYKRLHGMERATSKRAWKKFKRRAESCLRDDFLKGFKLGKAAAIRSSMADK